MRSYCLRNSEEILYKGFFKISRLSKILLIKKSTLGNLLDLIVFCLLSRILQIFINALCHWKRVEDLSVYVKYNHFYYKLFYME